ncbi:ABC transporter ATP-binding protein [Verrucomicrobiota bacterium]
MKETAVSVIGLGKKYWLGNTLSPNTLRDQLVFWVRSFFYSLFRKEYVSGCRQGHSLFSVKKTEFWALRDISFCVSKGEVVGIIGRNGAGKSTLLKVLCQITDPTEGEALIAGRVASLLEVGTGFHPELTGRENVYLNGSILGMTKKEIDAKFSEIVAFAEVDEFINTPVKRYSSGMCVRLAFAVAAHLEPEILIIDEVLAVGDAAFRRKCLGKMDQASEQGRTVLFVSHNMQAVRNLCHRTVWLEEGRIKQVGNTYDVTQAYLGQSSIANSFEDINVLIKKLPHDPVFCLKSFVVYQDGCPCKIVLNGKPVEVEIRYSVLRQTSGLRVYVDIMDEDENVLIRTFHDENADEIPVVREGEYLSRAIIPKNLLAPHTYNIVLRGTIFNGRPLTGEGIRFLLRVEKSTSINSAYAIEPCRAKLQPEIQWTTKTLK